MGLRAVLGASRARLLRQHLAEGTLLALCSGAGGLAIAAICMSWLRAFGTRDRAATCFPGLNIPRLAETNVDLAVAGFAIAVSVVAGLAFGVIAGARQPLTRRLPYAARAAAGPSSARAGFNTRWSSRKLRWRSGCSSAAR